MATLTADDLDTLLDLQSSVDNEILEAIIDQAIGMLNRCESSLDLPSLSGTAGSKSVSLEQKEKSAILEASQHVYANMYRAPTSGSSGGSQSQSVSIGGISKSTSSATTTSTANEAVMASIKEIAHDLVEMDVSRG